MARLRILVVAQETDGDVYALATCKFYAPGTATASGSSTSGTPFAGNLYAAISGGSPISTTQTLGSNGTLVVWTTSKSRVDVGIEPAGGGTAFVRQYEAAELDPADVITLLDTQVVVPTGTLAAPSVAWTSDLDTGFNVDSDGDVGVSKDGVGILETSGTTTSLRSPDGTEAATLTDDGVFAAPGLLRYAYVFRVHDEGMVYGTTTTNAAANKTAWAAMIAKIAASSEPNVDIHIDDDLPMDAGINLHHALSSAKIINIIGRPGRGSFLWNGTAGPFLTVGGASTSPLTLSGIYDIVHYFDDLVTSGAVITLGAYAGAYTIAGGKMAQSTNVGCHIGVDAAIGFGMRHYKIETRTSGGGNPEGIRMSNTSSGSGPQLLDVSIDGYSGASIALRFVNPAQCDTPILTMCHFRTHYAGILKTSGGGLVTNLNSTNLYLDDCTYNVYLTPPDLTASPGSPCVSLWHFVQSWMSCSTSNVVTNKSNGGIVGGIVFEGGTFKNATARAFDILACTGFSLRGGEVYGAGVTGVGDAAIYLGANSGTSTTDAFVAPNYVATGAASLGAIYAESTVTPLTVAPGITRGKRVSVAGTLSSARVILDHAHAT